ncbi:Imm53 family immunity protein [Streptomyces sp. NPDC005790]|uniref:Imm53 family immunity protein n=2 Tax=unclassified Streptomyces TaxID=2593676 RepID=UPI00340B2142
MAQSCRPLTSTHRTAATRVHPKTGKSPSDAPEGHQGMRFIPSWYASNCDGEWEHEYGIRMATTDNPGWHIEIDVSETDMEGANVERVRRDLPGGGWMIAWNDGTVFHAACDPLSLHEVDVFFEELAGRAAPGSGEPSL